jgi:murein DD-endopeptidase MepM/ murein hydrolase activator NlpD
VKRNIVKLSKQILYTFLVCFQLQAFASESKLTILTQDPQQGSMIIAKLEGEGDVYYNQKILDKTEEGLIVFGVGRDSKSKIELVIKTKSKNAEKPSAESVVNIAIKKRQWKIERVDGLPPSKISPKSKKVLERIAKEAKLVRNARAKNSVAQFFNMPFIKPAEGRISGVYGSQRVLNGEPKRPHFGLDIANKTGTNVIAPASGTVSLVHKDMFYSGGTLIIDHGFGISSTYIHLSAINVKPGQTIKQGELIGKIGATGRATGPHLDWRLNWFNTRLDPQLLIN